MRPAAVLFDLDGTLVDTLSICYVAFRQAVVGSGGPALSDADIHGLFGPSEEGMMQRVLPRSWHDALHVYHGEYERLLPTCPAVLPELVSILALLRQRRIPTGLVTGKGRISALMSLRHFGLDDAFDAIETGSAAGVVKAHAIRQVLDTWRIPPEHAIYVGDGAADMRAAREACVTAVGAAWAYGARESELGPAGANLVFTDAGKFAAWLELRTNADV